MCIAFLIIVILAQIIFGSVNFAVNKTAYYEDEYFSYALSNSYYRPFIYSSSHQQLDNYNTWESGDSFRYYIMTNAQGKRYTKLLCRLDGI